MKFKGQSNYYVDFSNEPDGVWIGDPCYVYPEEDWTTWCDATFDWEKNAFGPDLKQKEHYIGKTTECTGEIWYSWSTAFGDGVYPLLIDGKQVARLGVDAGTLSVIPMSLIKRWAYCGIIGQYRTHGHVVTDTHQLKDVLGVDEGDMHWGSFMQLPTGGMEDEEEDDCCEEGFMLC